MSECLFCGVYKDGRGIEYEDEFFYMRFDRFPVSPGHLLVIAKRHVESSLGLSEEEALSLHCMKKRAVELIKASNLPNVYYNLLSSADDSSYDHLSRALKEAASYCRKPDGYNFGENVGEAAGRTVHHFHLHVIPRYFGDAQYPRGGVRKIIAGRGDY